MSRIGLVYLLRARSLTPLICKKFVTNLIYSLGEKLIIWDRFNSLKYKLSYYSITVISSRYKVKCFQYQWGYRMMYGSLVRNLEIRWTYNNQIHHGSVRSRINNKALFDIDISWFQTTSSAPFGFTKSWQILYAISSVPNKILSVISMIDLLNTCIDNWRKGELRHWQEL